MRAVVQRAARGLVRGGVSATLRQYLARYPAVNVERLALAAGLDPTQLGNPEALLDQAQWFTLVEAAARETGDAALAIGFAQQMPWKDLGVLGYVALHSPTVGDALANLARYYAVQQTGGRPVLERGREAKYHYVVDAEIEHGQITEGLFTLVTRLVREATRDPGWMPKAISFRHDSPADVSRHVAYFKIAPRFAQRTNTMTFALADLDRRFVTADPGLLPHLVRHAEDCIAKMPRAADDDVRRAVIAALGAGDPAIERVAERLGKSARTLQRELQAEDTSFKEVVDATRLDLANRYLADPALSLTETAFLLGYSELSAFSRAFRRWTGETAQAFRMAALSRTARSGGSSRHPTRSR